MRWANKKLLSWLPAINKFLFEARISGLPDKINGKFNDNIIVLVTDKQFSKNYL